MRGDELDPFGDALSVKVEPSLTATYNIRGGYWDTVRKVQGRAPRPGPVMLNRDILEKTSPGSFEGERVRRILREYGQLEEDQAA